VLLSSGTVYGFGSNGAGQLGIGLPPGGSTAHMGQSALEATFLSFDVGEVPAAQRFTSPQLLVDPLLPAQLALGARAVAVAAGGQSSAIIQRRRIGAVADAVEAMIPGCGGLGHANDSTWAALSAALGAAAGRQLSACGAAEGTVALVFG
jgi:hypothetical protein